MRATVRGRGSGGDGWLTFNGIGENVTWGMYNNDAPAEAQKEQLYQTLNWAAQRGLTATFHWNNNRSVHHLLDVLERVNAETPIAPLRWSIAHLNDASPENLTRIKALGDWRGATLARVRKLIREAEPRVIETWKWRGVPVWEHDGILCTGETYKNAVKMTFAKGAALKDPAGLFTSSLDGNVRRAIDIHEGDRLNEKALKTLIRAAVALNKTS